MVAMCWSLRSAVSLTTSPGRSVISAPPSGRKAISHGIRRPWATVDEVGAPAVLAPSAEEPPQAARAIRTPVSKHALMAVLIASDLAKDIAGSPLLRNVSF